MAAGNGSAVEPIGIGKLAHLTRPDSAPPSGADPEPRIFLGVSNITIRTRRACARAGTRLPGY